MKSLVICLVLCIMAAVGVQAFFMVLDRKLPAFSKGATVHIYDTDSLSSVLAKMEKELEPLHPHSLERALKKELANHQIMPGSYNFKPTNSATYAARAITHGWQTPVRMTISGPVRTKKALANKIASNMMIDSVAVLGYLEDSTFLAAYGMTPSHLFETIIPDTYECYWNWGMNRIMNKLRKEYDLYWNKERRDKAAALGLTPRQVHILASIVAEESNRADEYPKIASVYITRLRKGMKLQACPTVRYIYNYEIQRVLYSHIANPSPYNTYIHEGLPPTPICLPEKIHLEAVLNPDKHKFLYFCADSELNGCNVFSESYEEHLEKARRYHSSVEEWKARKAREEADGNGI